MLCRFKGTVLLLGVLMLLQLLETAMAAEEAEAVADVVAAVRLAGVCNLAELFRVPHAEASTMDGVAEPKDKLLGGGGTDI